MVATLACGRASRHAGEQPGAGGGARRGGHRVVKPQEMVPSVTRWTELRGLIDQARPIREPSKWKNAMIVQLKRAVDAGICSRMAPHWIGHQARQVGILKGRGDAKLGSHPAISLKEISALDDARLTFAIGIDDKKRLVDYTV